MTQRIASYGREGLDISALRRNKVGVGIATKVFEERSFQWRHWRYGDRNCLDGCFGLCSDRYYTVMFRGDSVMEDWTSSPSPWRWWGNPGWERNEKWML